MTKFVNTLFAASVLATAIAAPASAKLAADNDLVENGWNAQAHNYIVSNMNYPLRAKRAGIEGQLKVRVKVSSSRAVTGVELLQTSGNRNLDRATITGLFGLDSFPALPAGVASKTLVVPVTYKIAQ
ncbi:energy transducer TonB [Kordiimonas sp. SCSIO 12610]|uniref:energy transducer TonB n=1 Tax=Kordiimonas sp. SCSIO 12610 TaxID=2829597 RepID=UPI00210D8316|nr:energy transducer TonB [Kordiimonas sp. SCSIO 12610]UTW56045.1 TonB family protein [Kordiimonas sp. SCSIO 12610]